MKVCFVVNDAAYFALHWLDRARAAVAEGMDVHLLCREENHAVMQQLASVGISWHEIALSGASRNPLNLLASYWQVRGLMRQLDPDLLHCITLKPCLIGAGLSGRLPVMLSFPGLGRLWSTDSLGSRLLRKGFGLWFRRASRQSRCLLAFEHDGDQQRLIAEAGVLADRTRVTGVSGVDPHLFAFSSLPSEAPPVVLFAARLLHAKGLNVLVRLCRQLRDEGVSLRLRVAGLAVHGDPDGIPLTVLNTLDASGDIEWLGACDDMAALITQATVVALPSRYAEGVPRILIEAASCGRPSVAFDRGGCRQVLPPDNSCGMLVADGDEQAFKAALKTLLTDRVRCEKAGLAGRQRVLNAFTSEQAARRNLLCYQDVLLQPGPDILAEYVK